MITINFWVAALVVIAATFFGAFAGTEVGLTLYFRGL
jgi:hypothetical protein